jgi:hypothetical protein
MSNLSSRITEAATNEPQQMTTDGQSVTNQPIADLIAADQYLKAAEEPAAGKPKSAWARLRPAKVIPPGAS